jgi:hypothetical protein
MKKIDIVAPVECPQLSRPRQHLWDAAAYMERHGKNQGGESPFGERVCVVVALARVEQEGDDIVAAWTLMDKVIEGESLPNWSDYNDQAIVVAAMRRAALS